jgi:hypothetical protein
MQSQFDGMVPESDIKKHHDVGQGSQQYSTVLAAHIKVPLCGAKVEHQ